ncbi:cytochrome P450 [Barrientosiimonas marina]|uniref:Cytochrome P450 n=1 Tax=Lentibacillus kimchii TaxID=1542911 RepID=A0ABW2UVW2_9BACI
MSEQSSRQQQSNESVNLFSETFNQNPYPTFRILRGHDPVYQTLMPDGHIAWIVTRYEDAVSVLKDGRFIKDYAKLRDEQEQKTSHDHSSALAENMLFSDPPDHKRLRSLVQQAFTPKMIERYRGRIEEITNELLDNAEAKGRMELVGDFSFPLPIIVICELLGIPKEDRNQFRTWSNALVEANNNPEHANENMQPYVEAFVTYLQQLTAERRKDPQDDLVSQLIHAEDEGDRLTEKELYGVISLLIIAGHETTVNLITNGVLALLQHPDQMEQLKNQPDLIHGALNEFLRYEGPVEFSTDRWANETVELQGKTIERGDHVLVALDSADHDPEHFDDPDVFDIKRESNSKHLAFGKGVHFCLGAPLADLEGEIAITTLLRRMPDLQLDTEPEKLQWRPGMLMRGLKELPVAF